MSYCQVFSCDEIAVARCDAGFRYCARHKRHSHSEGSKERAAILRAIRPDGQFISSRLRR